jgi:putative Holliday junction resolvase
VTRILGIDVGTVRVGVALSDPLGLTAQPLEVIDRRRQDPFARLVAIIEEQEVGRIVVGYPLRLDGSTGPAAQQVDAFITALGRQVKLPIERWDERLTTVAAERAMIEGGARRERRRQAVDKVAAALILQSYLEGRRCEPS